MSSLGEDRLLLNQEVSVLVIWDAAQETRVRASPGPNQGEQPPEMSKTCACPVGPQIQRNAREQIHGRLERVSALELGRSVFHF